MLSQNIFATKMQRSLIAKFGVLGLGMTGLLVLAILGCEPPHEVGVREVSPATIVISLPTVFGDLRRPPVAFDHGAHTAALEDEGCTACHLQEDDALVFKFARKDDGDDGDALKDLYHDKCIGCHKARTAAGQTSGPEACATCHKKQSAGASLTLRKEMAFDYSLHYRHVQATGQEKCDACHHQYDEAAQKLVYKKGAEDACRDCHGKVDEGRNLSLKNASHVNCITCHLREQARGSKHGPVLCEGCHDAEYQAGYDTIDIENMPRLERGQKDKTRISAEGAESLAVVFNHKAHETRARFCTTCHHKTPKPCGDCHTITGAKEGDGITTEQAFHEKSSERSCVGCHMAKAAVPDCAGCHHLPVSQDLPGKRTCPTCHTGDPLPSDAPDLLLADGAPTEQPVDAGLSDSYSKTGPLTNGLAHLPEASDDFPKTVIIDTLANAYKPSTMPHQRIAARLDEIVRASELATVFHAQTEVVCAGCHHHSPLEARPRPCKACHGSTAEPAKDKPGLKAAYHRQCMGCHVEMNIQQAMGCTDCHEKAAGKEVAK
ncbi:MAG: cytochrome c3 family protein [Myxococcota bacterium]|nr:cytochrome c3 family protein [Myxococcota bacterium]